MLAILITVALASSPKTTIFGDVILSYRDFQSGDYTELDAEGYRFDQADLGLRHQFSDNAMGYSRIALTGGSIYVNEAYLRMDGLPFNGSVTMGKFYKPLGASIPLTSLSFAALMIHSSAELGLKLNFSRGPLALEIGAVNGNPLTAPTSGSRVAGSPVMSNASPPTVTDPDNVKDKYARLALSFGEDWGSLTTGVTYTYGKLVSQEVDALNRGGNLDFNLFATADVEDMREHYGFDVDYQKGRFRVFSEYVDASDGRLNRRILSTAASYVFFHTYGAFTYTVGYDRLKINAERWTLSRPHSWNRERISASCQWQPFENFSLQTEYDWNFENARQANGRKVRNNGITVQSIYNF